MPLLKKTFKGALSRSKSFKTPLKYKKNINELLDYTSSTNEYNSFVQNLNETKYEVDRSSSPKGIKEKSHTKKKKQKEAKKDGKEIEKNSSFDTENSLSQDDLNRNEIKAAYVEFMNNMLATKKSNKKRSLIIYSSSEELLEELVEKVNQSKSKSNSKENTRENITVEKHANRITSGRTTSSEDIFQGLIKRNSQNGISKAKLRRNCNEKYLEKTKNTVTSKDSSTQNMFEEPIAENLQNGMSKAKSKKRPITEDKSMDKYESKKGRGQGKISGAKYNDSKFEELHVNEMKETDKKSRNKMLKTTSNKIKFTKKKPLGTEDSKKGNEQDNIVSVTNDDNDSEFVGLSVEEKMDKIHEMRNVGLYVLCDRCNKARYLCHVVDPLDLPDKWYCYMNPDKKHNKCSDPEEVDEDQEFLIDNLYNAGSIVYAKVDGFPWWPAMVEDDPDVESYFWLEGVSMKPTYYNVTFFDSAAVTRAWIRTPMLHGFKKKMNYSEFQPPKKGKHQARLSAARMQAMDALNMPLLDRLKKYGFMKRYRKPGKRSTQTKKNNLKNKENPNKKHKSMTSLDEGNVSSILGDVSLLDLSFNFLD